ncbi:helix-turn-helix domain-containing protein [Paraburkholderia piptadeniae]|uniref:helix-turn-helix domain-containing protein n=1 Tax=Paraburkholderia piptadeniae TaxID=1701573 RepID=UPI001F3448FE|nr:helix-turn-helix transcriptional regulator [Paraburkholderia piptadeniae]
MQAVFGVMLRERRLAAGLTQEQLAFEASIRRNYVSMLELGQHQPTLTMLFALATALDCTPSDLLADLETRLAQSGGRKHRLKRQRATTTVAELPPKTPARGRTR